MVPVRAAKSGGGKELVHRRGGHFETSSTIAER